TYCKRRILLSHCRRHFTPGSVYASRQKESLLFFISDYCRIIDNRSQNYAEQVNDLATQRFAAPYHSSGHAVARIGFTHRDLVQPKRAERVAACEREAVAVAACGHGTVMVWRSAMYRSGCRALQVFRRSAQLEGLRHRTALLR